MTGRTLEVIRAELEAQWLAAVVRQMNLRYQARLCDREIAALERRLEFRPAAGGGKLREVNEPIRTSGDG